MTRPHHRPFAPGERFFDALDSGPDPSEVAWHGWLTEPELTDVVRHREFVPDAREAFDRYRALPLRQGEM